ncbi:uncharacterized protein BX664DRAFT_275770 [Halteromyces radiatus]|uniref:uncharacterized protein n=1 Tax=Halteromyces radiatus TaxID=101107 RepID=UPI002220AB66|nr:uncharacterized protein BX664DRAFT_275770 [Halteromyces radiatus]KAI8097197.1 hypothetical protein BX664DRAFT_275770 [Halteromyces radiatus]
MFASTALIAALVKSQFPTNNAHDKLDTKTIEKVVTNLTSTDYDNDDTSTTGSQSTIVDDEINGIRLQSRITQLLFNLFQDNAQEKTRLVNVHHVVDYTTFALSDLVFVYPGTAASSGSGYLGQDLIQWSTSLRNIRDQSVKVIEMETRDGALQVVQGALEQENVKATVLTSTEALYSMIPNIHRLAAQRLPVVFNVSALSVDEDLVAHTHVDAVLAARQSGAIVLASTTAQEAHDLSVVSHLLAHSLRLPVIHYFDGALANDFQKVTLSSYSALIDRVATISNNLSAESILASFNYKAFDYQGDDKAETVLVTLAAGSNGLSTAVANMIDGGDSSVGLLRVRLYRPLNEFALLQALPTSVRRVIVLEEGDGLFAFNGPLYLDIAAAIRFGDFSGARPRVITAQAPSFDHLKSSQLSILAQRATSASYIDLLAEEYTHDDNDDQVPEHNNVFGASFWDVEQDGSVQSATHLTQLIHEQDPEQPSTYRVTRDAFRLGGSVVNTRLVTNSTDLRHKSDYIGIHNVNLIKEYNILGSAVKKAKVLVHGPWKHGDEIEAHLTNEFKLGLTQLDIQLYTLDAARIAEEQGLHRTSIHLVYEAAFFLLNTPQVDAADVLTGLYEEIVPTDQQQVNGEDKRDLRTLVTDVVAAVKGGLVHVELLPPWTILEINDVALPLAPLNRAAGISDVEEDDTDLTVDEEQSTGQVATWHKAAWQLMFKDTYGTENQLRPDLHESTYLVKLTENRRLTPVTYDRNVFHLEFDTTESNLKYELGDALGVHGLNDADEVKAFIKWYGLNEEDVVLVPVGGKRETRTVFQLFSQVLDIFGRPSKKFYEALANYATDPKEKEQLLYLVSAEGKEEFKKRVDDTVTYEDLLREFTSAKPSLEHLVRLVAPIKPRHYSIASSQKMHANSVHLLVVAVDWVNSQGKKRYGQCTRYLANLPVGADVTVSIKPSVMKLPPLDSQPVIMAGLGTGMAPFRAFIQERYLAKKAGKDVGPVVLYFGSRNRGNEYLYGEELEAYHQDGVLSRMGLAFSRDQKEKVYIQHKMKEDAEMLHDYLINKNGHFYLCGPTWPCGDIKDAVVYGLNTFGGIDEKVASDLIEEWKEKERYILEVY